MYFSNSSEIAFHSISETAEKLSVSRAQLVRVARMLGFDGYADLKNTLKRKLITQVIPASSNTALDNGSDIISELCRLEQANIDETYRNLTLDNNNVKDLIIPHAYLVMSMPAKPLKANGRFYKLIAKIFVS